MSKKRNIVLLSLIILSILTSTCLNSFHISAKKNESNKIINTQDFEIHEGVISYNMNFDWQEDTTSSGKNVEIFFSSM